MFARRIALALVPLLPSFALAQPVPVLHPQGTTRGFLRVRSATGALLGWGEFTELAHDDRLTLRLQLHFRDGSLDDEETSYTQHGTFRLLSDHHIQRGRFFSTPLDMLIGNGRVLLRTGDGKTESTPMELPADLANGLIPTLMLNIRPTAAPFELGFVVPYGKGRLIKLAVAPDSRQRFQIDAGPRAEAEVFRIKLELGGLAGLVAPMLGKQPDDVMAWVLEGEVPAIVRITGQLAQGGPVVSLELAGTHFAPLARAR